MDQCVLLLLLSHFTHRLCETPETAAHQAPPSLGFSRQEHWSGCHFLLQCMKVKSESEVAQSCPTLSNPMDCSPPGSSVHGVFQARVLEWVTRPPLSSCVCSKSTRTSCCSPAPSTSRDKEQEPWGLHPQPARRLTELTLASLQGVPCQILSCLLIVRLRGPAACLMLPPFLGCSVNTCPARFCSGH